VSSDAKTLYADKADIKVTGADSASPVSSVKYSLDGGAWVYTAGASVTVSTSTLGSHTLKACAVDSVGHVSPESTWTFSVKTTPKLYRSPNTSSISKRLYQTQTFSVTVRRATGTAVVGKYVYLERSTNGRTWTRYATLKTGSTGVAAKSVRFSARGYTYWRWTCPSDAAYNLVRTSTTKVTTR
jgi:hypothetical protein